MESIHPGPQEATGSATRKHWWLVRFDGGEERVEADEVEITGSGVLAFYRAASGLERERTLLTAFSPGLCWRCQLERAR